MAEASSFDDNYVESDEEDIRHCQFAKVGKSGAEATGQSPECDQDQCDRFQKRHDQRKHSDQPRKDRSIRPEGADAGQDRDFRQSKERKHPCAH